MLKQKKNDGVVVAGPGIYVACPVVDMDVFHRFSALETKMLSENRFSSHTSLDHHRFISDTHKSLTVLVENTGMALQGIQFSCHLFLCHPLL